MKRWIIERTNKETGDIAYYFISNNIACRSIREWVQNTSDATRFNRYDARVKSMQFENSILSAKYEFHVRNIERIP